VSFKNVLINEQNNVQQLKKKESVHPLANCLHSMDLYYWVTVGGYLYYWVTVVLKECVLSFCKTYKDMLLSSPGCLKMHRRSFEVRAQNMQ